MSTAEITRRIAQSSPRFQARIAIVFYLLTILAGAIVFFLGGKLGFVVDAIATVFYVAVTLLFYALTKGPKGTSRRKEF
jgi:cytochrome c biogenesis protein CcdA